MGGSLNDVYIGSFLQLREFSSDLIQSHLSSVDCPVGG
jgi:hypothetical protein